MRARFLVNAISFALGAGFTLCLFLSIAHFLRAHESAAEATVAPDDLETVTVAMPPPPPPPKAEEKPAAAPELSEALALGFAEEPSASPVKIAPSPPNFEELLPMMQTPTHAVAGATSLESSFKPTLALTFDENRIYQKSDVDKPPFPISRVEPSVPARLLGESRRRSVVMLFIVDTRGVVGNIRIFRSSDNEDFDEIVAKAVSEWTFSPAIKKGKAVRCMIQQQITVQMEQRDIFSL
ncbi:MAG: TonB family protein [Opitutae bacterium]|nr:TonB family protein [Opitutae bacterium]